MGMKKIYTGFQPEFTPYADLLDEQVLWQASTGLE